MESLFCEVCGERHCLTPEKCDRLKPLVRRRDRLADQAMHCRPGSIAEKRYVAELDRLNAEIGR